MLTTVTLALASTLSMHAARPPCRTSAVVMVDTSWRRAYNGKIGDVFAAAPEADADVSTDLVDAGMVPTYDTLAQQLLASLTETPRWVCVAGGPGSGKSTLAAEVAKRVNMLHGQEICVVLPMDGFHYSRSELRELDP